MKVPRLAALVLCFALVGCATDKYSFIRYGQSVDPSTGQYDAMRVPVLTDVLALNYANSVVAILRAKYTGARITREISSTAQLGLAAASAYGAAFKYSASTLAVLGLGSAGIPELQRLFGAKERAQTYQDAIRLIEEAEVEYLSLNQKPSATELTQNGVTLFQRVTASIHVVEKALAGNLPSVDDMHKATERMTQNGAVATDAGAPAFNNRPANADNITAEAAHGRYEGAITGKVVQVTVRPTQSQDQVYANKLRGDIKKLDEAGAKAMLDAGRQYAVLKPEFDAEPQGTMTARAYLFHLIDVAANRDDKQAELKAWRAIIPARPAVAATPPPIEPTPPSDKPN
ncbi:MAG: hypothetical protein QOG67_1706 [Verrucomicrobiota bacterium]